MMKLFHLSTLRKLGCLCLLFFLGFAFFSNISPPVVEGTSGMHIFINEKILASDQPPAKIQGRVMVPFRVLFTALGGTVVWDPETQTVTGRLKDTTVSLQVETDLAVVNQQIISLDVGARMINGRTMVPLRFVSETLGAGVHYDEDSGSVRISMKPVEGVFLDKRSLTLEPGTSSTLIASVIPQDAANKKVKWYSTDPRVARVNMISATEAVVTPLTRGNCIIFVETEDSNFIDTCYVEVKGKDVEVLGFSLSRTNITLSEGQSPTTIRAIIRPDDATNQKVTWSSKTATVATVHQSGINEGMITPLEEGETIITAKTEDGGYEAICRVVVEKYAIPVRGISLETKKTVSMSSSTYEYLGASISPRYASNQTIKWTMDTPGKVAIEIDYRDNDGYERVRLIPLSTGTVRITATTEDGNYSASSLVTVTN